MLNAKNKIIAIIGPTASGKTKLGVYLASKFNGEIVSADSRQVFRGMDVGTGKDLKEYLIEKGGKKVKVPYHLIDIASPKTEFNLAKYQKMAYRAIDDILRRGKLPILVGGSGLYLQAVIDGYSLSRSRPDENLRKRLEAMDVGKLFVYLRKLNPVATAGLNESDRKNKRRLVRKIEMIKGGEDGASIRGEVKYDALILGIKPEKEKVEKRIYKRLIERLEKEDMIEEVKKLHKSGISWKRMDGFGLEYRFIALYLQKKINYEEMVEQLFIAIRQFAKRQLTWFRRWEKQGKRIYWMQSKKEVVALVKEFIRNK